MNRYNFSEYSSDKIPKNIPDVTKNSFAAPHSNAFIDFNGDCAADLFITSVDEQNNLYFEIWLRGPYSLFYLVDAQQINYPSISTVSVGDISNFTLLSEILILHR